jgi:CBS domain-containing protein
MQVSEFMTPFVFSVNADTPVRSVVGKLLECPVRQMYVADGDGVLVGVLNAADLLRDFRRHLEEPREDGRTTAA